MTSKNKNVLASQSRLSNQIPVSSVLPPIPRQKTSKVPSMSPEAKRALALTKEEAKENVSIHQQITPPHFIIGDKCSNVGISKHLTKSNNGGRKTPVPRGQTKDRIPARPYRADTTVISKRSSMPQPTARSRSTLSHHEASQSVSDKSGYAKDIQNANIKRLYAAGSLSNNNTSSVSNVDRNNNEDDDEINFSRGDGFEDELDAMELNGNDESDQDGSADKPETQSFALTLDRTLEEHGVSRLRGDITDKTAITAPGTVRALNGGRLTNAQEVVVNVCYDDNKELVFHDDDEESLDTAKNVSNIRVSVWMEYNNNFDPDNSIHDHEYNVVEDFSDNNHETNTKTLAAINKPRTNKNYTENQREALAHKKATLSKTAGNFSAQSKSSNKTSTSATNNNANLNSKPIPSPTRTSPVNQDRNRVVAPVRSGSALPEVRSRASSASSRHRQQTFVHSKAKS